MANWPLIRPCLVKRVSKILPAILLLASAPAIQAQAPSPGDLSDAGLEALMNMEVRSPARAMLYNFIKFVEWPAGALGESDAPLVVGVVGNGSIVPLLEAALRNRTAYGHPFIVRRLYPGDYLKSCLLVFIDSTDRNLIARVLKAAGASPILTVGEGTQFSRQGGMVAFTRDGNRVGYEINLEAANRVGLRFSSKLLHLANVRREPAPGEK